MSLKLPHLLSTLRASGKNAVVRPEGWPANSFYRVTRSKLKFRLDSPSPSSSSAAASSSASAPSSLNAANEAVVSDAAAEAQVQASGKAWGQLFWKGKLVKPNSVLAAPAQQIRGGLKRRWLLVDPATLDATSKLALESAEAVRIETDMLRTQEVNRRRAAKAARSSAQLSA